MMWLIKQMSLTILCKLFMPVASYCYAKHALYQGNHKIFVIIIRNMVLPQYSTHF